MNLKRRSPLAVLLLSLITCGIYALYLIYSLSEELRPYNTNDSMTPAIELLLCIFCAPYAIYWCFKYSKLVGEAQRANGLSYPADNSVVCLILSLIGLIIVALMIMQGNLNEIIDYNEKQTSQS